ncbi:MAG: D-alanine--D-alanine ligase [Verrucomicrobia bacterium]|nr:D-alanine--D-alanine ligase [Verrucomicrobiota bacterium]
MSQKRFQSVAVLKGGPGAEREVSLRSGAAVAAALRSAGYAVHEADVRSLAFTLPEGVEAVFPVLHGEFGEDGTAQRRLEELGLPYVGSRSWEMPRSFDKEIALSLLAAAGLPVAPHEMVTGAGVPAMGCPLVVKAPRQGSSIGVEIVREAAELPGALARVRAFGARMLVERFIPGRECTVGFLGADPLPIVEIVPAAGVYDYEAKYQRGDTNYVCPARFPAELSAKITAAAREAYAVLGGRHLGRVDFRVTDGGDLCILELNPLPGFTATSLLPKAAAAAGLSFDVLCARIMELAEL